MNAGEALVRTLDSHGVDTVFCVPGESYLAVLESLRGHANSIRLITNRHESGATFAANGYAKISRKPGIAFVSRGPGATNASIGVHTADQDSVPLVLFIGQIPLSEIGARGLPGDRLQRNVWHHGESRYGTQFTRRCGTHNRRCPYPCSIQAVLVPSWSCCPKDVTEGDAGEAAIPQPMPPSSAEASQTQLREAAALIDGAEKVLIIGGEMIKAEAATMRLGAFAESAGAAVVSAFRCQDALNNDHPAYVGLFGLGRPPYLKQAWAEADLVILAGSRLDAITSEDFNLRNDNKTILMLHPSADTIAELRPTMGIAAAVGPTLRFAIDSNSDTDG